MEFYGVDPSGNKEKFTFAEGRWFASVCPDCGGHNGMGCVNEDNPEESYLKDGYGPQMTPCIWCGKGPMKMEYVDKFSIGNTS